MIHQLVETTSEKTASVKYKKKWISFRAGRYTDDKSVWMFIDGSSSGWFAAVILDPFAKTITKVARFKEPESRNIGPELWALLLGLTHADPTKPVVVVHDYLGTGAWMTGAWNISSPNVRTAVDEIKALINARGFQSLRFIHHAGHQKDGTEFSRFNNEADQLCGGQKEITAVRPWVREV